MEETSDKTYPVFFQRLSSSAWRTLIVTGVGMILALLTNGLYIYFSNDQSPDSPGGYTYAIVGSILLLLAALRYSSYRRSRKRGVGQLNGALNWHMCFGVLGLFILFLHAFGNFNPRTGTYALYGMIALVLSGVVGKAIDRILPRLITNEVRKAVTAQGEDRIESISQQLQNIMDHNSQEISSFPSRGTSIAGVPFMSSQPGKATAKKGQSPVMQSSWDLAYFSLDETPQELNRQATQYRFVPDRRSELARPGTFLPGTEEHLAELQAVQRALQLEQFYRYIIRYWRIFHIILAMVTVGLTIWHLVYAAQLLGNAFLH